MAAACAMLLGTLVLLLLVIDSGVITGLLRGGHLHGLRGARLKALPLLVAALMLQLLLGLAWFQVPGGRWGSARCSCSCRWCCWWWCGPTGRCSAPGSESSVSRPWSVSAMSCGTSACSC